MNNNNDKKVKKRKYDYLKALFLANRLQSLRKPVHSREARLEGKAGQNTGAMWALFSMWASSSGERIGVMRYPTLSTAGQWAACLFNTSPGVAHPLWETWLKWLKWGQSLIFPHSLILPGNLLSYFSCNSNREGGCSLIAWIWEVRKGLDTSSLCNTLGAFLNPTNSALFHHPVCHGPICQWGVTALPWSAITFTASLISRLDFK